MAIDYGTTGDNRFIPIVSSNLDNPFDGGGTWMCWFLHAIEASGAIQYLIDKGTIDWRFQQHASGNNRMALAFSWSTSGAIWFTPFPADISQGVWHHGAVKYNADSDANDPVFYIDGLVHGTEEATPPVGTRTANTSTPSIGGTGAASGNHIQEDMRWYNRELSDEEILTIANSRGIDGIVDGLIARWPQNEGTIGSTVPTAADTVKDVGPDAIHGTIQLSNPVYAEGELRTRRRIG